MKIALNGEEYQTEASTVEGLLEELRVTAGRVAVELNLEIVKKNDYQVRGLKEGDKVEIVSFIGGGNHPSVSSLSQGGIEGGQGDRDGR